MKYSKIIFMRPKLFDIIYAKCFQNISQWQQFFSDDIFFFYLSQTVLTDDNQKLPDTIHLTRSQFRAKKG